MKPLVAALCLIAPTPALACFGEVGQPLFDCTFEGGSARARVCLQDDTAYYAFGPDGGAPDLVLARKVGDIDVTPWPGIGRTVWEELTFRNGAYDYRLSYAFDKMDEEEPVSGSLFVSRDGAEIAQLTCDADSVAAYDLYPLYEAKEAGGECFTPGEGWSASCD